MAIGSTFERWRNGGQAMNFELDWWKSAWPILEFVTLRSEFCDTYFCVCDTHFRDLERRKFIIFSLLVIWVLSFTYTKPCQIQRAFCVFTTEKRLLWSFEKNCSCHQSFHQKRFSTKKNNLVKKLEANCYSFVKKERTSKLIKFWWQ